MLKGETFFSAKNMSDLPNSQEDVDKVIRGHINNPNHIVRFNNDFAVDLLRVNFIFLFLENVKIFTC